MLLLLNGAKSRRIIRSGLAGIKGRTKNGSVQNDFALLANVLDRLGPTIQCLGDFRIGPGRAIRIGLEQNPRPPYLLGRPV
jgi:hypothetical protein